MLHPERGGRTARSIRFPGVQPTAVRMNKRHKADRKPEIRRLNAGPDKVVRRNANDGEGDPIQTHRLSEHRRIAANRFCQ